jgi:hypothetical protein
LELNDCAQQRSKELLKKSSAKVSMARHTSPSGDLTIMRVLVAGGGQSVHPRQAPAFLNFLDPPWIWLNLPILSGRPDSSVG